jgi:hypothetical protein
MLDRVPSPHRHRSPRPRARPSLLALTAASLLLTLVPEARAEKKEATFSVEVAAGAWKGARVRNIPAGAKLGVETTVDGPVEILLVLGEDYRRAAEERPLFKGSTSDRLSFSVIAPESGDYYVVIDNRKGASARSAVVTVTGEPPPLSGGGDLDSDDQLREFERRLGLLFEFDPFPIRVGSCPSGALVLGGGVVLCEEYVSELRKHLDDRKKMEDVLLFTLLHEIGHVLLRQWSYPTYANEETADEFATVLVVMLGQEERLDAQAEFFHANASLLELIGKAVKDDRHPLSAQRARNIRRWSRDEDLVRRWQPVLVPRMQRPVLEKLLETPAPWTDVARVRAELAARR